MGDAYPTVTVYKCNTKYDLTLDADVQRQSRRGTGVTDMYSRPLPVLVVMCLQDQGRHQAHLLDASTPAVYQGL